MKKKSTAARATGRTQRKAASARSQRPAGVTDVTGTPLLDHIEFNFVPYFVALTVVLLGLQLIVRRDGVVDARSPASMTERPGVAQLRDADMERERPYREPMLREPSREMDQPSAFDAWRPSRK